MQDVIQFILLLCRMKIRNILPVAVLAIIIATVTSETSVFTTCKAVSFFGKYIVICAIPPKGTILLLHSRNSEQTTPDPAYQCTWTRGRPSDCWGTHGFDFFANQSDAERVTFQIPQDSVHDQFFCKVNDGRPFKSCSFNVGDMNVSVSYTNTTANSICTCTTEAPCLCSSDTKFWIVLVVLIVTVVLVCIGVMIIIICLKLYCKRCQRRHQRNCDEIQEMRPINGEMI